jgi:hypothetical protein
MNDLFDYALKDFADLQTPETALRWRH